MGSIDDDGFKKPKRNRSNMRKRPAEEVDEEELLLAAEEREALQKAKMQKQTPNTFSTREAKNKQGLKLLYESDKQLQQSTDQGATREVETETAKDRDARSAHEI